MAIQLQLNFLYGNLFYKKLSNQLHNWLLFIIFTPINHLQNMSTKAVIYIKDIQKITGKSYPSSQREHSKIKALLGLKRSDYLTLSSFCQATKISIDDAILALNNKNKA